MNKMHYHLFFLFAFQFGIEYISGETVSGCTINNNNNRRITHEKTSVTLSCANNGYILVRNLTFGVHKNSLSSTPTCSYQPGDCTTRTTYIGMECNGLTTCDLDLNPQYLHICSQYSDYMVLDYSCLQGPSLSVCENRLLVNERRVFLRSPNYPQEYENSLNCSCQISNPRGQAQIKFLDFYLEERDELNLCSRDQLQIANRSYCGSTIDENQQISSIVPLISSFQLSFKTNDVITRKGFWLMIDSEQPLQISCNHLTESPSTTPLMIPTTTTTTTETTIVHYSTTSLIPRTDSSRPPQKRRHTLSYILILTIVFVVVLLLLNLLLIALCWRQRRPKKPIDSKTHRPFICSSTSSSSSITYGGTPVLTSLDAQKQHTLPSRYVMHSNQSHLDTTPSTSTTTATGPYEDLTDTMTLQRQYHHEKTPDNHSLYTQNRPIVSTPNTAYNRMIHFPPIPIRCHFSIPAQTFYPPQPLFDSQHIYETIQDGQCPYQRLAATLRRQQHKQQQQSPQCTCYYEHAEQAHPTRTQDKSNAPIDLNPETLV